ncbi:helix-turn-helix domain-containing protein [Allokutzneria sp. A3M-2-11 16]|uniref:helix-turn-helix domain-containing protein n=1 Tax=Allokutzneria sp. A3M-2-11 16 TaxID=2962043 RepID=UPI0020B6AE61|nr:helix-turn-helix transcriptional regulator [Allokutzneria sp. A3M-2-11 16]MCP3800351.1 helix-turn-helix domain-containing protein [Allokutzneria sp. A3M-2-11 16]
MTSEDPSTIGAHIRRMRRTRDLTLQQLADLSGLTKGYLSRVENGKAIIERRSTLTKIANALRCSVADFTGAFVPTDAHDSEAHATLPDIQRALVATSFEGAQRPSSRGIDELETATVEVAKQRQECRYPEVGKALPELLLDLHAVAASGTSDETKRALCCIVQTCQVATLFVKNLGQQLLAWTAAQRGCDAAAKLGDPTWIAVAEFANTQALIGLGLHDQAESKARNALALPIRDTEQGLQVYATNVLTSAFCSTVTQTADASAAIEEAAQVGGRVETGNAFFLGFSAVNVDLWRVSIALEDDDADLAAEIARKIIPKSIPLKSRRAAFLIEYARAIRAIHGDREAMLELLLKAEKLAPVRTRANLFARDMISEAINRARTDAGGRQLLGLADRMGLVRPS